MQQNERKNIFQKVFGGQYDKSERRYSWLLNCTDGEHMVVIRLDETARSSKNLLTVNILR